MHKLISPESRSSNLDTDISSSLRTAFLLASFLICLYLLTYNGKFRVDDEHILASRAQSIALRGKFEEPQVFGNRRVQGLQAYGDQATQIEPLLSLFGALFYRIGLFLGLGGAQTYLLLGIYVTALTAGLIYLISRMLSVNRAASLLGSLFFGLGSMAWPYAMAFFRDTLAMFFAALVLLGFVMRFSTIRRMQSGGSFIITLGSIGGILSKNSLIVVVPAILLGLFLGELIAEDGRRSLLRILAFLVAPIFLLLGVITLIPSTGPLARFSLDYYAFLLKHFIGSINVQTFWAFLGPIFSPAKSILVFNPALILVIPGVRSLSGRQKQIAWVSISFLFMLSLAQALFYRELWAGTFGWGLRYLLPSLPGLFILVSIGIQRVLERPQSKAILIGFFLIGFFFQLSGVLVSWADKLLEWQQQGFDPYSPESLWSPRFLTIPYHIVQMFTSKPEQVAWVRTIATNSWTWLIPGVSLLFGIAIAAHGYCLQHVKSSTKPSLIKYSRFLWILIWISPVFPNLFLLERDPYWLGDLPEPTRLLGYVSLSSQDDDVLLLDSYGTPLWNLWMNRWDRSVPYFALPFEVPMSQSGNLEIIQTISVESEALLTSLSEFKTRAWYVASSAAPDYLFSGEVSWLESHARLEEVLTVNSEHMLEARLYTFP